MKKSANNFFQPVEGVHTSCLEYFNMWMEQYDELYPFCYLSLMVLHHRLNFQLAVQYVHLKGVTDDKYFDDFCPLQKCAEYIYIYFGLFLPIIMDRIFR